MEVAIELIYHLDYSHQLLLLAVALAALVLPLLLNRSEFWKPSYQQLEENRMLLEMQKLLLEINEKVTENSGEFIQRPKIKMINRAPYFAETFPMDAFPRTTGEVSYYEKVRHALLGSLLFFLLMGIVTLQWSEVGLISVSDHLGYLARELGLWAVSAFGATLIPWGSKFFYYAYGFFIPILVSFIVVILLISQP